MKFRSQAVLTDPHVQAHLGTLDLDIHEGTALFHLLDAWQNVVKMCLLSILTILIEGLWHASARASIKAEDNGDGEAFWGRDSVVDHDLYSLFSCGCLNERRVTLGVEGAPACWKLASELGGFGSCPVLLVF